MNKKIDWKDLAIGTERFGKTTMYQIEMTEQQFLILMDALSGKRNNNTALLYQKLGWLLIPMKDKKGGVKR